METATEDRQRTDTDVEWRRLSGDLSAAPGARAIVVAGAVFAVVSVAALIVISAGLNDSPGPRTVATAGRVDVVGDSLIQQAQRPLQTRLDEAGYASSIVGLPAQSLSAERIRARLDAVARTPADVLVLATATNDVRSNGDQIEGRHPAAPSYRDAIVALLYRFSGRCVVVVNARDRTNPLYLPERAAVLNGELAQLERSHSNLVVVDWAGISRELPAAWFSPDLLHFAEGAGIEATGSPGARVYADAIAGGVRRCLDRRGPTG